MASANISLYIAIFDDGAFFKHWGLYIEDDNNPDLIHVQGGSGNFRLDVKDNYDARNSKSIHRLIKVADVRKSSIPKIKEAAEELKLNCTPAWNCQSFVLDLILQIDELDLIDISQEEFNTLCRQQDGLL